MPTEQENQEAETFLGLAQVPKQAEKFVKMKKNDDGSVTITNLITGHETVVTREAVITVLRRRAQ